MRERCDHAWQQQWTTIFDRPTPIARWVCSRCGDATDADPVPAAGASASSSGRVRSFAGSGSWSFRTSSAETLDAVLWLRDTFALPVAPSPLVPPPLTRPPEVLRWPAEHTDLRAAALAWAAWWAHLTVASANPVHAGVVSGDDVAAAPVVGSVFAPLWSDACAAVRSTPEQTRQQEQFPHALLCRVVDDVAFDLDVEPGELHGAVTLLAVTGPWWHLVAPGRALAAADLRGDEPALQALLTDVLRSAAS